MFNQLKSIVNSAIEEFNENEAFLIKNDLSERCICAKFALYLQSALNNTADFSDYIVDVEYNRGMDGKDSNAKILYGKKIVVDLIAHRRGYDEVYGYDNLICIEMKKSTNRLGCIGDEQRLRDLVSLRYGFGYKMGVMLIADMTQNKLMIKEEFLLN